METARYEEYLTSVLMFYPELAGVKIQIREVKKALFPYACRPDILSLFRGRKNRVYYIFIAQNARKGEELVLFSNLTEAEKIGILGHEVAHVVYYEKCSLFKLIGVALNYFIPAFRRKFERDTDTCCIKHGLGKELWQNTRFVHDFIDRTGKLKWVKKYYLSPLEIENEINSLAVAGNNR